jgi:signal transduction histidine kinase/CheY-like chemotaxis protein
MAGDESRPMRELVNAFDWATTPLGPRDRWSPGLKTAVSIVLNSDRPMILMWGPELIQVYNDAFRPSFGLGKHPRALGQRAEECWHETWPVVGAQIERVLACGPPLKNEGALIPIVRNGRIEDVYWSYTFGAVLDGTDDAQDNAAGVLIVCEETTKQVLAERRQQVLALLAERLNDGSSEQEVLDRVDAVVRDNSGDIRFVRLDTGNAAATDDTHAPVVRRTVALPDAREATLAFGINAGLPFDGPYQQFLDRVAATIGAALSRAAEAWASALAAADQDRLLMDAPVGTAVFLGDALVVQWANRMYCDIIERYDIAGKTFDQVFPDLIGTALQAVFFNTYRTGVAVTSKEEHAKLMLKGVMQDRYYTYNLVPLRNPAGGVRGLWVIVVDITDQVVARKESERLNDELNVAARTKDEFLAMLGHELRNPLAPIVTALQLMKLRQAEVPPEQVIIQRQVDHLVRLVDDLLDVSKITRGMVELRPEPTELRDVLTRGAEMAGTLLERKKHRLTIDSPSIAWYGDPARLAQVVSNLLTNAARYTPEGGQIDLTASVQDGQIVLRVSDNGVGISAELLPRIFEPFVQGRRNADRAEGGLGIGLALVKNLVELHGGRVSVHSAGEGQGSQFTVELPQREGPVALAPTQAAHAPQPVVGKRVLVVDDNRDAADSLTEILKMAGYEVAVAYDPVQAIEKFPSAEPQIAVLDIGLPGMDGYELAARLRELRGGEHCRFIALTGYGQDHDRRRSTEAGFSNHLIKPVDVAFLRRLLDEHAA